MFSFVRMHLRAWPCMMDEGVGVGMDVYAAIIEGAAPRTMVDENGVASPAKACTAPAKDAKRRADDYGGPEADGSSDDEAGTWSVEDDRRIVDGDVVVGGVDGLDLEVAAIVDDVVVGVRGEVAIVVRGLALTLDGVHDVGALAEDGVAEGTGPLRIAGHHVEDGGEGEEREDAGIPGKVVCLDGLGERISREGCVLLSPGGGIGDLIPEGGCGEDLGEKRVRVEGDALDELIKFLRRDGRGWSFLLLLRVGGRWGWWWVGLGLLLIRRRGRLADDRGLCEDDDRERQESQCGEGFVGRLHTFVYLRFPFAFCALS